MPGEKKQVKGNEVPRVEKQVKHRGGKTVVIAEKESTLFTNRGKKSSVYADRVVTKMVESGDNPPPRD